MNIFEWMTSSQKKRAIERFMLKLINRKHLEENRPVPDREEPRCHVSLEVRVMDWTGRRGDPATAFSTVTRDITTTGVSFVADRVFAPEARVVVSIYFDLEYHHLLCEVRHCTPLGRRQNLIGCVVVSKLDPTPELAAPLEG